MRSRCSFSCIRSSASCSPTAFMSVRCRADVMYLQCKDLIDCMECRVGYTNLGFHILPQSKNIFFLLRLWNHFGSGYTMVDFDQTLVKSIPKGQSNWPADVIENMRQTQLLKVKHGNLYSKDHAWPFNLLFKQEENHSIVPAAFQCLEISVFEINNNCTCFIFVS